MDESALKILIKCLEQYRSSLDWWLGFWTTLVVIGVILEVVFIILDHLDDLDDWKRGTMHPPFMPSRPKVWRLLLELFAAGLVALGVAGELLVDAKIGSIEQRLKEANDNRVLLLQKEAGNASVSAQKAQRAAEGAIADEKQLAADLATATSRLEVTQKELGREQRKTAKAQAEAAKAQLALKQYVEEVARSAGPRQIDAKAFLKELKDKPKGVAIIWYNPNDSEAFMFASQIKHFLGTGETPNGPEGAGWVAYDPVPIPATGIPHEPGIRTWSVKLSLNGGTKSPSFQVPSSVGPNGPVSAQFEGAWASGLTVLTRNPEKEVNLNPQVQSTPVSALVNALIDSTNLGVISQPYSALPDGWVVIVVGQKR